MVLWIRENWFNYDPKSSWNESLSSDAKSFVRNWYYFPINVLFSVSNLAAPDLVTLSFSLDGPISRLALFRAVGSLLASATFLDKGCQ